MNQALQLVDRDSQRAEALGAVKRGTYARFEGKLARVIESSVDVRRDTDQKSFKYYITFVSENRRLDRWIEEAAIEFVSANDPEVEEAVAKQQRLANELPSGYFKNDENKGLDQRQVADHEAATRVRTIANV